MAIVKAVVTIYCTREEKHKERYKPRIQIGEDLSQINIIALIDFLGLIDHTKKFGFGLFYLKL